MRIIERSGREDPSIASLLQIIVANYSVGISTWRLYCRDLNVEIST